MLNIYTSGKFYLSACYLFFGVTRKSRNNIKPLYQQFLYIAAHQGKGKIICISQIFGMSSLVNLTYGHLFLCCKNTVLVLGWEEFKVSSDAPSIKMPKELQDIAKPILERLEVLREVKLETYPEFNGEGNGIKKRFHKAKVPLVPGTDEPDFLFFGLDANEKLYSAQIKSLSSGRNAFGTKLILAHTGAGKTRFCVELLSTEYGFYFSSPERDAPKPGSHDLEQVMNSVASRIAKISYAERRNLAIIALHCMFLARALIFLALYQRKKISCPLDWLLVQMYPALFLGEWDVFAYLSIAKLSHFLDTRNFEAFTTSAITAIEACKSLVHSPKWNVVFDESQRLKDTMKDAFLSTTSKFVSTIVPSTLPSSSSSNDGSLKPEEGAVQPGYNDLRSAFSPVLRTSQNVFDRVICCGTGLTAEDFRRSERRSKSSSGVDSDANPDLEGFPRLLSPDDVKNFLKRVLIAEQESQSDFVDDTIDFAASWLTGRPHFTVWFLKFLARSSLPLSRESVERFAIETRTPTLGPKRGSVGYVAMKGLERLQEVRKIEQIEVIRHALFEFVLYGENTESIVQNMAVVEEGIATLGLKGELEDPQKRQARFMEPLMAESIRQCMVLKEYDITRLVYASGNQSSAGFQFEEVVALALANLDIFNAKKSLMKLHPLEELSFSLLTDAPSGNKKPEDFVSSRTRSSTPSTKNTSSIVDRFLDHVMSGKWQLPLSQFGHLLSRSGSAQRDLAWLRNWCGRAKSSPNASSSSSSSSSSSLKPAPKRSEVIDTPCLLPSRNMGPDIAFVLNHAEVDSEILFVFIQCKYQDGNANFTGAAQTVDPSQFYAIREGANHGKRPQNHAHVGKEMDELLEDVPVLRKALSMMCFYFGIRILWRDASFARARH